MEINTAFKSPCGGNREDGDSRGEKIEAGKGIPSLGCCGAGGGTWAMPYDEERLAYGSMEADLIKATGAEIVVAPRHHCRDQIMKGLSKVHDLGNYEETLYLWELVANCSGDQSLERIPFIKLFQAA